MFKKILLLPLIILLSNCSGSNSPIVEIPTPGLFSKDSSKGVSLSEALSGKKNLGDNINVNAYLWRASLNVLSIAPLVSTDALGGTIITDWYVNANIKNQRLKITVFILSSELRSDGFNVKAHIQNFKNNTWSETFLDNDLSNSIEESILNEARNLRLNSLNDK